MRATRSARFADLTLEVGRVREDGNYPAAWSSAGFGSADFATGTVALEWTVGGEKYFLYFNESTRIVASDALDEWPGSVPSLQDARHPADPLWFIFAVNEALEASTADAREVEPGLFRVQVDLLATIRAGGALRLAYRPQRRLISARYRRWMTRLEGEFVLDEQQRIVRSQHFAAPSRFGSSSANAVHIRYRDGTNASDALMLRVPVGTTRVPTSEATTDEVGLLARLRATADELREAYRFGFQSVRKWQSDDRERPQGGHDDRNARSVD